MGFPNPAADHEENTLRLDDLIVHPEATFFIKMRGVAMEPTIHHGDLLVVDRALTPLDFQAVVVVIEDEFRVRRIIRGDESSLLRADNPEFPEMALENDAFDIWGVITYAVHKLLAPTRRIRRRSSQPARNTDEGRVLY